MLDGSGTRGRTAGRELVGRCAVASPRGRRARWRRRGRGLEEGPRGGVGGGAAPGGRGAATRGPHRHGGIQREADTGVFGGALGGPAEVLHVHGWTQVVARDEGA